MQVYGVIPARYGSTRFPGKPLVEILGKPLLRWVWEGASTSKILNGLVIATDDSRIFETAKSWGAQVQMTKVDLPAGTDRVWEVVKDIPCDVAVNIQGDEPLIDGTWIDQLADPLRDATVDMSTLGRKLKKGDLESATTAKIVLNQKSEAIYFSRFPIPYSRQKESENPGACLKHVGIYAFQKKFLGRFCNAGPQMVEMAEGLEQLRALHLGARIKVVPVEFDSWGVDTPEDVEKIETLLKRKNNG